MSHATARTGLGARIALLVVAVAVAVGALAGLVGAPLIRRSAAEAEQTSLAQQADLLLAQLSAAGDGTEGADRVLTAAAPVLAAADIALVRVSADGTLSGSDAAAVSAARRFGAQDAVGGLVLSGSVNDGGAHLVQARSTAAAGFALVSDGRAGLAARRVLERRVVLALVVGGGVAVLAGLLAGALLARPLRRTAALARAVGAGERSVRVPVSGPTEVADLAVAVNDLADGLDRSEARQREFLASVSHELRTPLAGISGQADALADGLVPPAETAQVGLSIRAEAARLERLVGDLLDLARVGDPEFRLDPAPVDLGGLIGEMARVWRTRAAARGAEVRVEVAPGAALVVCTDARRVRQVLDGLAENALRMLSAGEPLVLAAHPDGDAVTVQVRDGGPGLAADDYPVAFEPGVLHERYRGRRPGGAGLGLALAAGLVGRMGGSIGAGPAAEGGLAVTVRLPLDPGSTAPPAPH